MYSFDSRVRYSEVDESRRMSVTGIMNYLQDCSTFQSEDLGLGIDYLMKQHRAWWLTSWQIIIDRYPRLGEKIVISTWPYDFKGMYGYRNFTIQDEAGNYLVKADSTWFFFDTEAGRPVRIQEDDLRGYGAGEEERLAMPFAPRHIALPDQYQTGKHMEVARHHIDTNHHVNNAQYIEIAREYLPPSLVMKELRVEYKKAAVLGDRIIPRISREDESYTVALCGSDDVIYAVVWVRPKGENDD